jgi:hypothetical protein
MSPKKQKAITPSLATPNPPAKAGPCKLSTVSGAGNGFQAKNSDMPIDFALSSPDGKTEFLNIEVRQAANISTVVAGQPTASLATSFTLNLPVGDYIVIVVVGALPSAKPVWVTESCVAATKLDWIAVPVNTSGEFSLKVV